MIRPAKIEDLPALLQLETQAFATDRISRRSFRHLLTRANAASLVDEDDGGLCGYVTVLFHGGSTLARLYSIAVEARCRGRRKGEALLRAAEEECRRRGRKVLRLEVHPDNTTALRLYEKGGFRTIGMYRSFYEDGADALRMEKRLCLAADES